MEPVRPEMDAKTPHVIPKKRCTFLTMFENAFKQ
ncbi:hypothetical protein GFO_1313 [Christiangramia forsetii KT0803]|uniref:Uncharacterized protein n=1 Tax=Christiangramia forsetii (strain DSM 17595 / CGMCC 1.15422 / KT0803) TaxID=411154 RepID=A0M0Z1_CHRFK|nr:hypothetical protein GFO_1313 [Christiangramia forsetii KT0803]|tara:strand:+ start:12203 stop:12304 length:102 start_codon:yes stop_codon:yes gene_type:complete